MAYSFHRNEMLCFQYYHNNGFVTFRITPTCDADKPIKQCIDILLRAFLSQKYYFG